MEVLKELNNPFQPIAALVAYKNEQSKFYLETHPIVNGKLGPGKPISADNANKIKELFNDVDENVYHVIKGIIPRNLLYCNSDRHSPILVWYSESRKQRLEFTKNVNIPSGYTYVPRLLWCYKAGSISVFAVKSFGLKAVVYNAPFTNIYTNGTVCMGNVNIKKQFDSFEKAVKTIEGLFFNSQFNGHITDANKQCKVPLKELWANKIVKSTNKLSNKHLWKENNLLKENTQFKTIEDVINQFK